MNREEWPDQSEMIIHMPTLEEYASRCGVIWELGCGHGNGSTRAFVRGLDRSSMPYRYLLSVDIDPDRPECMPLREYWGFLDGDTREESTAYRAKEQTWNIEPDLIYIDTEHTYEQMQQELAVWSPYAGDDTVWLFHDTWMFGTYNHMTDAIKEFAGRNGWIYTDLTQESHGLGEMRHV